MLFRVMPPLTVSSIQHVATYLPPDEARDNENQAHLPGEIAGEQGSIANIPEIVPQESADANSPPKNTSIAQDDQTSCPETTKDSSIVASSLQHDPGGEVRALENKPNNLDDKDNETNKQLTDEETGNIEVSNDNDTPADLNESGAAGAESLPLHMYKDPLNLPEDLTKTDVAAQEENSYYALAVGWAEKAELERRRRGSIHELYTLMERAPRFVLEVIMC